MAATATNTIAAMVTATDEGVVDKAVLEKARALVAVLQAKPAGAEFAPTGSHPMDALERPVHLEDAPFAPFMRFACKSVAAVKDYKYWGGADEPWRNGVDDTPVARSLHFHMVPLTSTLLSTSVSKNRRFRCISFCVSRAISIVRPV